MCKEVLWERQADMPKSLGPQGKFYGPTERGRARSHMHKGGITKKINVSIDPLLVTVKRMHLKTIHKYTHTNFKIGKS